MNLEDIILEQIDNIEVTNDNIISYNEYLDVYTEKSQGKLKQDYRLCVDI